MSEVSKVAGMEILVGSGIGMCCEPCSFSGRAARCAPSGDAHPLRGGAFAKAMLLPMLLRVDLVVDDHDVGLLVGKPCSLTHAGFIRLTQEAVINSQLELPRVVAESR